jgi:hypothetical protein
MVYFSIRAKYSNYFIILRRQAGGGTLYLEHLAGSDCILLSDRR